MRCYDFRFDIELIHKWIGKEFKKYRCDSFDFTNSVTQNVSIFIGSNIYLLSNKQELVDYFGTYEDISVYKIKNIEESDVKSAFNDVEQIDTPINEKISKITLINENQQIIIDDEVKYDVWLTRAICFFVGEREIFFEKDNVPFSEEVIIRRGYDLMEKLQSSDEFLEGWDDNIVPRIVREKVDLE